MGFSRAIFLLCILDQTINAFMGLFTWSSALEVVVVVLEAEVEVREVAGEAPEGVSRVPSSERLNMVARGEGECLRMLRSHDEKVQIDGG